MKIPFWQRWRLFQKAATGILLLFFGIMAFVTVSVYMRKSGVTGIDMAQVQKLRDSSR
jgi:hypothetical protein